MWNRLIVVTVGLLLGLNQSLVAQSAPERFQVGAQVSTTAASELEETDVGVGGRVSWHPVGLLGVEAEVNLHWRDLPDDRPITRGRIEALSGVTVGPRFNRFRPFARLRSGVVNVQAAPAPFPCIRIFPPPLLCELGAGRTLLTFDVGGGLELFTPGRMFFRVDVGDRLVRYPGPVFDRERRIRDKAFFDHDVRFAAGAGVRFGR